MIAFFLAVYGKVQTRSNALLVSRDTLNNLAPLDVKYRIHSRKAKIASR